MVNKPAKPSRPERNHGDDPQTLVSGHRIRHGSDGRCATRRRPPLNQSRAFPRLSRGVPFFLDRRVLGESTPAKCTRWHFAGSSNRHRCNPSTRITELARCAGQYSKDNVGSWRKVRSAGRPISATPENQRPRPGSQSRKTKPKGTSCSRPFEVYRPSQTIKALAREVRPRTSGMLGLDRLGPWPVRLFAR
jgi:hypothetical protein